MVWLTALLGCRQGTHSRLDVILHRWHSLGSAVPISHSTPRAVIPKLSPGLQTKSSQNGCSCVKSGFLLGFWWQSYIKQGLHLSMLLPDWKKCRFFFRGSQRRKSWIWEILNHVKDNISKKPQNMNDAENKTTSRKELGTSFQNACSEPDEERLKAREEESGEKLFRNQLGIVCSYQNTLLTQTCHGANICSQLAESVRGMLSVYYTGTPRVDLAHWT